MKEGKCRTPRTVGHMKWWT